MKQVKFLNYNVPHFSSQVSLNCWWELSRHFSVAVTKNNARSIRFIVYWRRWSNTSTHITCHKKSNCSQTTISVNVQEPDPVNVRLHKASFIPKLRPTIKSRAELTELSELLFWIIVFLSMFFVLLQLRLLFYQNFIIL